MRDQLICGCSLPGAVKNSTPESLLIFLAILCHLDVTLLPPRTPLLTVITQAFKKSPQTLSVLGRQQKEELTVELKRNDWCDGNIAEECSFRILRQQNGGEISTVSPSVSAYFRRIYNFEIISQVSERKEERIWDEVK